MENSTYVPTSLQSPALMVLASTAEASRDAAAIHMSVAAAAAGQAHHFSPGAGLEAKEIHVPFTTGSFAALSPALYGQHHEGFHNLSAAHLLHMHAPFLSPNMERTLGFINPTGGGAFRPVSPAAAAAAAERNGFHSAFLPTAKCPKLDQNGGVLHHASHRVLGHSLPQPTRTNHTLTNSPNSAISKMGISTPTFSSASGGGGSTSGSLSPVHIKDEGSSDHDTSGSDYADRLTETPLSDITDGTERSTPDDSRVKSK